MEQVWNSFLNADIALPMISSLVTGFLIGLERELRFKPAGLRTHTLVCFASTLLMLAATRQADWIVEFIPGGEITADPTRMAHGVLTGIGFLGAGVIFREGSSVHGLTTAASLWISAALGLLYGVGMYWLAVSGTISALAVLILFRLFYFLLPRRQETALQIRCAPGAALNAAGLRAVLDEQRFHAAPIAQRSSGEARRLELATVAWLHGPRDAERLADVLAGTPGIEAFQIVPVEELAPHAADWR